ncbi:hypothetical protein JAAARDRAFT_188186 [Jaapia argillacea MUCL 33604]|uniref:Cytochrome P450 n=1 Tax=Jaapia argillacea MUCL 33604 TaxID=933084 RepID=A0A067QQF8_9AGAM|nr:hypothetical protein JAAARDRAFT_188186 [Jaapia argillacea MUCL 33604]
MAFTSSIYLDATLTIFAIWLVKLIRSLRLPGRLPPGPRGLPLVGNLLDMPTDEEWKAMANWQHSYGDLTYLCVLGQPFLFINSPSLANEILDKKSANYSERPTLPMASHLVGWDNTLVFARYGSGRFLEQRRLLQSYIGNKASMKKFWRMEESKSAAFLKRVLDTPANFVEHIRWYFFLRFLLLCFRHLSSRTAGAIILQATYGYDVLEDNDPLIQIAGQSIQDLSHMLTPGAFLVDVLPILRHIPAWFPGAEFQATASRMKDTLFAMANEPYKYVTKALDAGTATPSLVTSVLTDRQLSDEEEYNLKWVAASMYAGGSDTSVSAIHTFFLAMTMFPDVQKLAQSELDRVVGPDRLPSFLDRENLPYVDAVLKEVLRWAVVTPRGGPHSSLEDDVHDGYYIPKGTIVIPNVWQVLQPRNLREPALDILPTSGPFQNPMEFNPDRFLGKNPEKDPSQFVFGFGRRICPGIHLADSSMFISIAMMLAVFNISKAVDPVTGKVFEPAAEFSSGGNVVHPKPFKCSITPRSSKAEELINNFEL